MHSLLLCNDDAVVKTVTRAFKDLDVHVEQCRDQKAASHKIAAKKFDAIVADDDVAGADQLLEEARALPTCQKSVRIVLAGAATIAGSAYLSQSQIVLYKPLSAERVRHGLRAVRNLMARERRRGSKRVRVDVMARLTYGKMANQPAIIEDLSDTGAALRIHDALPSSDHFSFECVLPDTGTPLKATAEVVWRNEKGVSGIHFTDMSASCRRMLTEWLRTRVNTTPEGALKENALGARR